MNAASFGEWFAAASAWGGTPWLLVALAAATLASDDLACIGAGLLVAAGRLDFWSATAACFVGVVAGDLLLVAAGRWAGRAALRRWPLRGRVAPERLARAERWFAESEGRAIFASRFVPGTRLPLYLAAGVLRAPWLRLAGWFALAVAVWAPLVIALAWRFGEMAEPWLRAGGRWTAGALAVAASAWGVTRLLGSATTWRGRRLWVMRWRRLTRWEYWPIWAVYPPVAAYALWLGWRHGGLTVCTAANPGMGNAGGLVGESKSEILRGLAGAGERVAAWTLIDGAALASSEARMAAVAAFQAVRVAAGEPAWPVVLKPDVGERGRGVVIARSEAEVRAKLAEDVFPLIAQAYVSGVEFGVFYTRFPTADRGSIFAITEKQTQRVVGDGRRTLEKLILEDPRAVAMATYFLEQYAARLDEVPSAGESVVLAELGTHCRGAVFLDGARWLTPALEEAVERVSRSYAGFFFGRYDVRAASAEAFARGEFTVIELNGLSAEATSIYDPRHPVWYGWGMLCRQWRLAYEIGAANHASGARVWSPREVLALLRATRQPGARVSPHMRPGLSTSGTNALNAKATLS